MHMLPIFNIVLNEDGGMDAIALVQDPAIEVDFLKFAKTDNKYKFNFSEDKREIFGPVCIPELLIYRFNESIGEYYVKFSKEVIKEMILKYSKDNLFNSLNFNHNEEDKVNDVYLIESFLKDTEIGLSPVNFEDCPDGTWFCRFKVCNDELWDTLKNTNEFKGFSLEGMFGLEKVNFNKDTVQNDNNEDDIDNFINDIYKN